MSEADRRTQELNCSFEVSKTQAVPRYSSIAAKTASAASSYGAAGSVVALMLWIYYSAQIFFFGAELTRQYALQFGSLRGVPGMGGEGDGKGEGKPPAWPANR